MNDTIKSEIRWSDFSHRYEVTVFAPDGSEEFREDVDSLGEAPVSQSRGVGAVAANWDISGGEDKNSQSTPSTS